MTEGNPLTLPKTIENKVVAIYFLFALKGQNVNSPGQNDEGVTPRVKKNDRKPSV